MTIGENIKLLREQLGMSQQELADKAGFATRTAISKIENNANGMTQSKIAMVAKALNTTPSYLMGWEEKQEQLSSDSTLVNELAIKIKELRTKHKLTLEDVASRVGVGKSTVRKWEIGMIANMGQDKVTALAEALHTTPGYLMGWEDNEQPQEQYDKEILDMLGSLSKSDIQMIKILTSSTEEEKRMLLNIIKAVIDERK